MKYWQYIEIKKKKIEKYIYLIGNKKELEFFALNCLRFSALARFLLISKKGTNPRKTPQMLKF